MSVLAGQGQAQPHQGGIQCWDVQRGGEAGLVRPALVKLGELEHSGNLVLVSMVCLSLAKPDTPHHLTGLYTWAKVKSGTKLKWILCLTDLLKKQTESGVKSLRLLLEGLVGGQMNLGVEEGVKCPGAEVQTGETAVERL